jgi:putative addiction module antidote
MAHHTKLRKIGNSLGVILPKEVLAELNVQEGQDLYISKQEQGGVTLTPRDEEFERQMEIGRNLSKRYRNALRELAK